MRTNESKYVPPHATKAYGGVELHSRSILHSGLEGAELSGTPLATLPTEKDHEVK